MRSKQEQGRRNRRYGHDAERELARDLRDATGYFAERITSESKHGNLGDVVFKPGVTAGGLTIAGGLGLPMFKFQIKSGKRPSVWKAIEQACSACAGGPYTPVGFLNKAAGPGVARDRLVIMHLMDWLNLVLLAFGTASP